MQVTEQVDAGRAWLLAAVGGVGTLLVGALALPDRVYWGFIWQYFWGPVYADAHNAVCAVYEGTGPELVYDGGECRAAIADGAIVAEPGYTLVSEVGYMLVLLFALLGVLGLLRRLDVGSDRGLFYALVPFMLFGGVLRVVEDANDAVPAGVEAAISYPWNSLLISPVIYFTVFGITLAALVGATRLAEVGTVDDYVRPLAATGSLAFLLSFGYLVVLSTTREYVDFHPQVLVAVVVIATALSFGVYRLVDEVAPRINAGTGRIGLVVIWGHAIDGVANVIAADWLGALGVDLTYYPKHPANRGIINITEAVLPESLLAALGSSWPFLVVKLGVALGVVWIFDERLFEENPRYALLLLIAIVAVGLGPGTRDMVRATFGI